MQPRALLALLAVVAVLLVAAGAEAAQKPSFAGSWSGTYTITFDKFPCVLQGCLPGSPAYCERNDPACSTHTPQTDFCPGLKITGAATINVTQSGAAIRGTAILDGGVMHRGDRCTTPQREDYRFPISGESSGASASIKSAWPTGTFKALPNGKGMTGSFTSSQHGYTAVLTLTLTRA